MVGVRNGGSESEHVAIMWTDEICKGKVCMPEISAVRAQEIAMGMKLLMNIKSFTHHENGRPKSPVRTPTSR